MTLKPLYLIRNLKTRLYFNSLVNQWIKQTTFLKYASLKMFIVPKLQWIKHYTVFLTITQWNLNLVTNGVLTKITYYSHM